MPELRIQIPDDLEARITAAMPNYLDRKGFLCLLIDRALDTPVTLGGPSEAGPPSTSSSTSNSSSSLEIKPRKTNKSRKRTKATPEFEAFWAAYQACPRKVPAQSKAKAWEQWQAAVKHEAPERLLEAAQRAVKDAMACEWDYKLPDAFRWLRDGRYSVLLEDHATAQPDPSYLW